MFVLLGLAGSTAIALDYIGPPAATVQKGQLGLSTKYSYTNTDFEFDRSTEDFYSYLNGSLSLTLHTQKSDFKIKELKTHKLYTNLAYGVTDNLEMFLLLGTADADFDVKAQNFTEGGNFNGDTQFAIGFGTRATFYQRPKLKLGGLFQISWAQSHDKLSGKDVNGDPWTQSMDLEFTEVQIAVGPTYQIGKGIQLYGGPFYYFVTGDLESKHTLTYQVLGNNYRDVTKISYDIDDDCTLGGYVGAQLDLIKNISFNIEYQHTSDADALGMGFMWRF